MRLGHGAHIVIACAVAVLIGSPLAVASSAKSPVAAENAAPHGEHLEEVSLKADASLETAVSMGVAGAPFASSVTTPGVRAVPTTEDTVLSATGDASGPTVAGVTWIAGTAPEGTAVEIRTRTGDVWSEWLPTEVDAAGAADASAPDGVRDGTIPFLAGRVDEVQAAVRSDGGPGRRAARYRIRRHACRRRVAVGRAVGDRAGCGRAAAGGCSGRRVPRVAPSAGDRQRERARRRVGDGRGRRSTSGRGTPPDLHARPVGRRRVDHELDPATRRGAGCRRPPHGRDQHLLRGGRARVDPRDLPVPRDLPRLGRHRLQLPGRQVRRSLGRPRRWSGPRDHAEGMPSV